MNDLVKRVMENHSPFAGPLRTQTKEHSVFVRFEKHIKINRPEDIASMTL